MGRIWIVTCTKFKMVRELLGKREKTIDMCKQILTALQACCDEISATILDQEWRDSFIEFSSELQDESCETNADESYPACEEIVNELLNEMYDLCDNANVWLEV